MSNTHQTNPKTNAPIFKLSDELNQEMRQRFHFLAKASGLSPDDYIIIPRQKLENFADEIVLGVQNNLKDMSEQRVSNPERQQYIDAMKGAEEALTSLLNRYRAMWFVVFILVLICLGK